MELSVGNVLLFELNGAAQYRFQNFYINETLTYQGGNYSFLPFGFSGVTVNRNGDNTEANLVLPNNDLSRAWTVEAVKSQWFANIQTLILNPSNKTQFTQLSQYWSRISSARWDETSVVLTLSTVLDAVGQEVPNRRLTQKLVGAIPVTNAIRLQ